MNRENKRKQYEKGYYKNHACEETMPVKKPSPAATAAAWWYLPVPAVTTATTVPIVSTASMWISSPVTGNPIAAA